MYREIYIDVVFVTNFLMDFVLLYLTGMFLGIHTAWYRCFFGAVLGAVSSCFILFIPTDYVYPAAFVLHVITGQNYIDSLCTGVFMRRLLGYPDRGKRNCSVDVSLLYRA